MLAQFFSRDLLLDTLREDWGTWAAGQSQGEHLTYPYVMLWKHVVIEVIYSSTASSFFLDAVPGHAQDWLPI